METIKIFVQVPDDRKTVILGSQYQGEERHCLLTPERAVEVANSLLHAAEQCGVEVQVQTTHHITDMQRLQLIARVGHIMRSMSGRRPDRVALNIVDSILAEIL